MASSPPVNRRARGHLHAAALSRVGASKTQAALAKIIAIISAAPSPSPPAPPRPDAARHGCGSSGVPEAARGTMLPAKEPGFCVDLRLRLGPPPEIGGGSAEGDGPTARSIVVDASAPVGSGGDVRTAGKASATVPAAAAAEDSLSPAVSAAGRGDALTVAKSSEGECDPEGEEGEESHEEAAEGDAKKVALAEQEETKRSGGAEAGTTTATTVITSSSSSWRERGRGGEGCLDLLLEAVRQVSCGAFDDDDMPGAEKKVEPAAAAAKEAEGTPAPPSKTKRSAGGAGAKKRRETAECWIPFDLYEEETAPIVRSKRGRSQALPSRYRDSVLDPWRKPPALARHARAARP